MAKPAASEVQVSPFYYEVKNEIVQPGHFVACSRYFVGKWLPRLGGTGVSLVMYLRSLGYYNPLTGERRNGIRVGLKEMARACGCSERTIQRELEKNEALGYFVRVEHCYAQKDGRPHRLENIYYIAMDDPIAPEDEPRLLQMIAEREQAWTASTGATTAASPCPPKARPEPVSPASFPPAGSPTAASPTNVSPTPFPPMVPYQAPTAPAAGPMLSGTQVYGAPTAVFSRIGDRIAPSPEPCPPKPPSPEPAASMRTFSEDRTIHGPIHDKMTPPSRQNDATLAANCHHPPVKMTPQKPILKSIPDIQNNNNTIPNDSTPAGAEDVVVALRTALFGLGVSEKVADALCRKHPQEEIEAQIKMLHFRDPQDPAAVLVTAIRENWAPPARYLEAEKERTEMERREEAKQRRLEEQAAEARVRMEMSARAQAAWNDLSAEEQSLVEVKAQQILSQENSFLAGLLAQGRKSQALNTVLSSIRERILLGQGKPVDQENPPYYG